MGVFIYRVHASMGFTIGDVVNGVSLLIYIKNAECILFIL